MDQVYAGRANLRATPHTYVPDSLAQSYRPTALCAVAALAESKKSAKYAALSSFIFTPVAIESLGAMGHQSSSFITYLGRRMQHYSGDDNACQYLVQCLSVTLQRGNAALMMDTLPSPSL
uniref:Uncharacterized protein n=1 Tax=Amphimedon queenslandica TaxID=400682 RepID=A0A1X7V5A8_AMPQE